MTVAPENSEEMEVPPEDLKSGREVENIGEKFTAQLPKIKQMLYAYPDSDDEFFRTMDLNYEQIALDESRLFVHHRANWYRNTIEHDRSYFSYNSTTESFAEIASCNIETKPDKVVELSKIGRIARKYDREFEALIIYFDNESPSLAYDLRIFSGESVQVTDQNSAQTKATRIHPQFNNNELSWLKINSPLADISASVNPILFKNSEEMEQLTQKASEEGGFSLENEGGQTWARITYKPNHRTFEMVFNDSQGLPAYTVTLPRDVDAQYVIDETRAKILLENPELPPEVDEYWKRANFGDLLGIKVIPVVG